MIIKESTYKKQGILSKQQKRSKKKELQRGSEGVRPWLLLVQIICAIGAMIAADNGEDTLATVLLILTLILGYLVSCL